MFLAMITWGASWINAKVLSKYITADELIFYRYLITSLTMLPILLFLRLSFKITARNLMISLVSSLFLIAYTVFYFLGTKYGEAGIGGAFTTTLNPIITFILMVLFFKKKFTKIDALALFLGAIGVMTILRVWQLDIAEITTKANSYFVFAAVLWAFLTLTSSKQENVEPLIFSFYIYIFTTVLSLIYTKFPSGNIFNFSKFDSLFWIHLLSLSAISTTFGTSIYFIAVKKLGANKGSSFIFLVPFNAIFLSYIFLDEPIFLTTILGAGLTIFAVYLLNKKKKLE